VYSGKEGLRLTTHDEVRGVGFVGCYAESPVEARQRWDVAAAAVEVELDVTFWVGMKVRWRW